jgi:cell division initiation protein
MEGFMKLSPLSIKKQEFNKSMRGYDQIEVSAYLEKLADEFELLQKENETLKKELEGSTERLAEYRKIEKNLQSTLLKAQESSSKSLESTKKQANLIIKEAEIKASQILEKARENANEIRSAVIHLREERDMIVSKLKAIINTQSKIIETKLQEKEHQEIISKVEDKEVVVKEVEDKEVEEQKDIDIDFDDIVNKLL